MESSAVVWSSLDFSGGDSSNAGEEFGAHVVDIVKAVPASE